jgi:hypothetical protein
VVLWAGSLWSTVWVALMIFHSQPDRHLSGVLAARLFAIETYLGLAVALFALARDRSMRVAAPRLATPRVPFRFGFVAVALLLFNEWVLKIFMDQALARGSALGLGFGPWHGISALIYLAACLSAAVAVCTYEL